MEASRPIQLPAAEAATRQRDELEITVAIELVARRSARRVMLSGLKDAANLAPDALASAQAEGVDFALARDGDTGAVSVVVGPLTE